MNGANEQEAEEIAERISVAWDTATLDIVDRLVDHLRALGIDVPTIQELAKSAVSGSGNDPAVAYSLATYTHGYGPDFDVRKQAHRLMLEDVRNHRTRPK